jgi:YVTN family beta-propeller protein
MFGRERFALKDGAQVRAMRAAGLVVADALAAQALERISVGLEPSVVRLDRDGRRAYVLDRRSGGISVVDVAGRAVARTVATDPEPVAAQLDRAGTRLYVVHRGSAYLTVLALPELTVASRIFVGLGASAVEVDPRTALVYVGSADERGVQVFDPLSFAPMAGIELPAPVSFLAIDALENALVAVMPAAGQVGYVDIASRRLTSAMDVGPAPDKLVVVGERR